VTRLRHDQSFLLVVDVQEKLAPRVAGHERLIARAAALVRAAKLLGVPVLASEHCPDRIGGTVEGLRRLVGEDAILRKVHFSCADEEGCLARFAAVGRRQVLVAGMEAHVCVMQTALGLRERGFEPFIARDAVGSQRDEDRDAALARMAAAGCEAATAEMAIFEWMHRADDARFRDALEIVKAL
jgi:nicotinamidase-related amidase